MTGLAGENLRVYGAEVLCLGDLLYKGWFLGWGSFFWVGQFLIVIYYHDFTMKFGYQAVVAGAVLLSVPGVWGTEWVTSEKLQADVLETE